jgi:hypothetical protein
MKRAIAFVLLFACATLPIVLAGQADGRSMVLKLTPDNLCADFLSFAVSVAESGKKRAVAVKIWGGTEVLRARGYADLTTVLGTDTLSWCGLPNAGTADTLRFHFSVAPECLPTSVFRFTVTAEKMPSATIWWFNPGDFVDSESQSEGQIER